MNTSSYSAAHSLNGLVQAIAQAPEDDGMLNPLTPAQWEILSAYVQPVALSSRQVLFAIGSTDRTLYLVESGSLNVHYQDEKERVRLAVVKAGSVVGEAAFFSHLPRSATVQANEASVLWSLNAMRFTELGNRQPAVALAVSLAAAAVLAKRLGNRRRRVAST